MQIDSSQKAFTCLQKWVAEDVEEFWVLALNTKLDLIERKLLFRGTANSCLIHPRDLVRFVCSANAVSFVIAHNHPSGDPRPSAYDIQITKKIFHLGRLLEIPLNDHLILAREAYFSFADSGHFQRFQQIKSLRLNY